MKSLIFIASSILMLSFGSCQSVGYHANGNSTIIRHDTVHITVHSDKPITVDQEVH